MKPKRVGRKSLMTIWLSLGFAAASYYNGCGQVHFDQSSSSRLNDMQSTATILINHDAPFTKSALVEVELSSFQSDEVYVTNDPTCKSGGQWQALVQNMNWTLGQLNQETQVYAKFRNVSEGLETTCVNDAIVHDDVPPSVMLSSASSATNVTTPIINFVATDSLSGLDQQMCQWPGQPVSSCNFSTSNGNVAEGRYLVQVSASDHAGNVSVPVVHDLIVDRTPPVITILSGPPALSNYGSASFNFNAVDDRSGLKSVECSWENNSAYAACSTSIAKSVTEGNHKLYIRAVDLAGNMSEINSAFSIDLTAPTVRILTGPNDYSNTNAASFTFDGNDGGTAISKFECHLDSAAFSACTSATAYTGLSEGLHTFEVRGYDNAGNLSSPASRKWYVDTTPPAISFVSVPAPLSNLTTAVFKYNITDSGSGVDKSLCSLDAGAFTACPADGMTYNALAAGAHKFQVRATDKAGNSVDSSLVSFIIDLTPPTIQFTATPGPISNLAAFTYMFLANDANGVDYVECRLDSAAYAKCDSLTSQNVSGLSDGNHTFSVRATDKAGNKSAELAYNWMVDLTPPTIAYFQPPPTELTTGGGLLIGFTAMDGGSGLKAVTCLFDAKAVACQSGVALNLGTPADGNHTFVVTASDNAGNAAQDTKTIAVKAPTLVTQNVVVSANKKVDVLVIMDNSGSMADEMTNMATRMSTFLQQLAGLDWQLGIITTDVANDAALKDGRLVQLKNSPDYLLSSAMDSATAQTAFANTIQMNTNGSGNERGFKAAIRAMQRSQTSAPPSGTDVNTPNRDLFRADAALAVLVVSDAYDDSGTTPENVISTVKGYWPNKAFSWHSVVVPGSSYTDPNGTKVDPNDPCAKWRESVKYDGREYIRLSALTGGVQGNECLADYGSQLKDMGKSTADLVNSVTLDCNPVDHNGDGKIDSGDVMVTDSNGNAVTAFTVSGSKVTFTATLPLGTNKFQFYCVK